MRLRGVVVVILLLVCMSVTPRTHPAGYTFSTLDMPVPPRTIGMAVPDDISSGGLVVATINSEEGPQVLYGDAVSAAVFRCVSLPFADASGASINDHEDFVGHCVTEPNGRNIVGFIRSGRAAELLRVPNADHTVPVGVGNAGQVVGHFYDPSDAARSGPVRIRGFLWSSGRYETIDFPGVNTHTLLRAVNQRGQILGEYYRFDVATHRMVEHQWFLYENGQFSTPFEPSLEWQAGRALMLADINDAGQIVGLRYNGGPGWDGPVLFDHGIVTTISVPAEIRVLDVRGMNNKGQFVGFSEWRVMDPLTGERREFHAYLASPQ
jgi:hypothetical protein